MFLITTRITFLAFPRARQQLPRVRIHCLHNQQRNRKHKRLELWWTVQRHGKRKVPFPSYLCHSKSLHSSFRAQMLSQVARKRPIHTEPTITRSLIRKNLQESVHQVSKFEQNNIYVCDLGSDKIWHYSVTNSTTQQRPKFTKLECTQLPMGSGPRHMVGLSALPFRLHLYAKFLFVVHRQWMNPKDGPL